jgi:hypothetical protein
MAQKVTIGRIIEFFPSKQKPLPNGMQSAPAIVVQTFGNPEPKHININVFTASGDDSKSPVIPEWSIPHKDDALEGGAYWDWLVKV